MGLHIPEDEVSMPCCQLPFDPSLITSLQLIVGIRTCGKHTVMLLHFVSHSLDSGAIQEISRVLAPDGVLEVRNERRTCSQFVLTDGFRSLKKTSSSHLNLYTRAYQRAGDRLGIVHRVVRIPPYQLRLRLRSRTPRLLGPARRVPTGISYSAHRQPFHWQRAPHTLNTHHPRTLEIILGYGEHGKKC